MNKDGTVIKKTIVLSFMAVFMMFGLSSLCFEAVAAERDVHEKSDPLEPFNRAMFRFNYEVDRFVLKPVAKGYRNVTNKEVRKSVGNAIANLKEPISFANHILQLKPKEATISLGRFAVNSTLGLAGLFDVATGWGWTNVYATFDKTRAHWCVPDGPYLVLPFVGPTTPRNSVGRFVDSFADPVYWATEDHDDGLYAYAAYLGVQAVVFREATLELMEGFERDSVDLYATMRSAYIQNRMQYRCGAQDEQASSYDFDFDIED